MSLQDWMLAHRECSDPGRKLIQETIEKQSLNAEQAERLTLHNDRGAAMKSHNLANLLACLGIKKSHSRPHVSNDIPYSESQFKTLKYQADFPERFGFYEDALACSRKFFDWYINGHYHSGIGFVTTASLPYGRAKEVIEARQQALKQTCLAKPQRFVKGIPQPMKLPTSVWINPPVAKPEDKKRTPEVLAPASDKSRL
jgi:putative transposase